MKKTKSLEMKHGMVILITLASVTNLLYSTVMYFTYA